MWSNLLIFLGVISSTAFMPKKFSCVITYLLMLKNFFQSSIYILFQILSFFFFVFLGLHLWHVEIPRLGVQLELQLLAYTTATAMPYPSHICDVDHSSQQCWILNPLSKARDLTCVFMNTIWVHYP